MQSNTHAPRSTALKRQSKSIPKNVPAGGYPDPALVQQKLEQYRQRFEQQQQGQ